MLELFRTFKLALSFGIHVSCSRHGANVSRCNEMDVSCLWGCARQSVHILVESGSLLPIKWCAPYRPVDICVSAHIRLVRYNLMHDIHRQTRHAVHWKILRVHSLLNLVLMLSSNLALSPSFSPHSKTMGVGSIHVRRSFLSKLSAKVLFNF